MKTITWHGVLQAIAMVVQVLNVVEFPPAYKPYVATAVGILQVILHQYALNQPAPNTPPVQ